MFSLTVEKPGGRLPLFRPVTIPPGFQTMVVTKSNPRSVPVPGSVLKGWRLLALRLTQKPPGAGTILVGCQCRVIRTGSCLAVCLLLELSFSCCSNTVLPPKVYSTCSKTMEAKATRPLTTSTPRTYPTPWYFTYPMRFSGRFCSGGK